jgi:hypothetical protein
MGKLYMPSLMIVWLELHETTTSVFVPNALEFEKHSAGWNSNSQKIYGISPSKYFLLELWV